MASANDMKAHQGTYGSFVGLLKWSVPTIAIIALIVIFLIS
ncbi:aa3-type cytochrome c oxidase subunit IV [Croceibacterium aestuarii]|nr:aa3-type cytochrome c oxidase subunit IV [Croceibacterium sp. D39]